MKQGSPPGHYRSIPKLKHQDLLIGDPHLQQFTSSQTIAFILKGYPRLSETFIAQEIHALEQHGLGIHLFSLRHPSEREVHPIHDEIRAPVNYLPEYLHREPLRVLRGWWVSRRRSGYSRAFKAWLRDLYRDRSKNRIRRFGQALVLVAELPTQIRQLHAHFLHTPASVARYASLISGLPWSASAHAKDIWTSPDWEKTEKLAQCRWLVTCTAANQRHLASLACDPERVELLYHGLDFQRFPAPEQQRPPHDGTRADEPVVLLSVGRAVAKKGYHDLLAALATLPRQRHWRFIHIGGGALLQELKQQAQGLGIAGRLSWLGPQSQQTVLRHYRNSDLFVLPCRIDNDGDRDGLPNVLMEAQSQKLACLSTRISGVPELIQDQVTGLLVEQRDIAALSAALDRLISDPALRARLGNAGYQRVRQHFTLDAGIQRLALKFGNGE